MIDFHCDQCNSALSAPQEDAGSKINCPVCSNEISVPEANSTTTAETELENSEQTAEPAESPEQSEPTPETQKCPQCDSPVGANAVLCSSCGHNIGGETATIATTISQSLTAPVCLGAIGATLGGVIWAAIVYFTGYEVGFVAWGIGIMAGVSTILLTKERSKRLGVIAATMALVGLLIGKIIIFQWLTTTELAEMLAEEPPEWMVMVTLADPEAMFRVACNELADQGEFDDEFAELLKESHLPDSEIERTEEIEAATVKVLAILESWDEPRREEIVRRQIAAKSEQIAETIVEQVSLLERIKLSMSFWDAIWFFFAISSAYSIGAGRNKAET